MNGATDIAAPASGGGCQARSRKNAKSVNGSAGNGVRRRVKKRPKGTSSSRGRGSSNLAGLCCVASAIFLLYLLVCFVFFHRLGDPKDAEGPMTGLVKKAKHKVSQFRAKPRRKEAVDAGGGSGAAEVPAEAAPKAAPPQAPGIPPGVWPASIRDEDGNFEEIAHPGVPDGHETMLVPRFWADDPVAIHQNKLMSRQRALSIGTCIAPDPDTGSFTRGDRCPFHERSVFVAIASYRDWQVRGMAGAGHRGEGDVVSPQTRFPAL